MGFPSWPTRRRLASHALSAAFTTLLLVVAAAPAQAAPLPGSSFDTGDGNQENGLNLDWQNGVSTGRIVENGDPNGVDSCFVGGTKENTPEPVGVQHLGRRLHARQVERPRRLGEPRVHRRDHVRPLRLLAQRHDRQLVPDLRAEPEPRPLDQRRGHDDPLPHQRRPPALVRERRRLGARDRRLQVDRRRQRARPHAPTAPTDRSARSGPIGGTNFQGVDERRRRSSTTSTRRPTAARFPANSFGEAAINLPAVLRAWARAPASASSRCRCTRARRRRSRRR